MPGQVARGRILYPGYEHVVAARDGARNEAGERLFLHVASVCCRPESGLLRGTADARRVPAQPDDGGTLLVITESGFDHIPAHRRMEALRMNTMGWDGQAENIAKHVSQSP